MSSFPHFFISQNLFTKFPVGVSRGMPSQLNSNKSPGVLTVVFTMIVVLLAYVVTYIRCHRVVQLLLLLILLLQD